MARSTFTLLRAAAVAALASQAVAQTCYYANGKKAANSEKPCSSAAGSACCPDTWQCLDNGLCYNPAEKIYGRYSCTDQSWDAPGCPSNMCIYGKKSNTIGAEAITQCSNHNNQWCCDADRTNVNCCQESPSARPFFNLQDGRAYATIGSNQASTAPVLSSITGLWSGSATANAVSSTPAPSSGGSSGRASSATSRAVSSAQPVTSEVVSVSSGSQGLVTIIQTIVSTPPAGAANGTSSSSGGSSTNIGLIVGCAVGIPLALALLGIIIWMLRKRRNQKKTAYKETPEMDGDSTGSPTFAGGAAAKLGKKNVYRHSKPGTSEIDSNPVGPGRPVSNIPGRAELDSGAGFQPGRGAAYGPDTVGIGGGNGDGRSTWASPPPGYSPGMNQTGFHQPAAAELDATTAALPVINEKPQQYQAYRPPQPAAELPTVKTPPEDVEKQLHR
ncbi:hypothetical protein EK21DRAFT_79212 [Setomelanomma holmii]|uniref:Uncharacterized protein n=1 Tax=Setomelanomma holmii TaxID=210430 RepID=A0A9P4GYA4_9PLEO|nr:hypothetical protein EK21DRAFT_79212 [Setomelanomma holmii]